MSYTLNMAVDRPWLTERIERVSGMDAYQRPTLLPPDIFALMENRLVTDNGKCKVRPGFDMLGTPFSENLIPGGATYNYPGFYQLAGLTIGRAYYWTKGANETSLTNGAEDLTASGHFIAQAGAIALTGPFGTFAAVTAKIYDLEADTLPPVQALAFHQRAGEQRLVAVCNRTLHNWNGSSWSAAIAGWTATSSNRLVQLAPMNNKLYVVDGTQRIFEFDGSNFTALAGGDDPQAGATMIVSHADRLFAAGWDGTVVAPYTIRASDLRDAGTGKWHPINFDFQVGSDYAPITALVPMLRNWLVVFKQNAIHMVNCDPLQPTAATWLKQELTLELGCVGRRAAIRVGGDCWFWSQDGIRGITSAVGTEGAFELVAPYSQPMQPYVDRVNLAYKHLIAAHRYRDLVFFAVPLDSATEPSHTLVFNARLRQWMGVWSGVTPTCWATTRFDGTAERLVMGDTAARVNQWKDLDDQDDTATYTDNGADIASTLTTKSFNFGEPDSNKDGDFWEFLFDVSVAVNCTVTAYYDTEAVPPWTITDEVQNGLPVDLPFDLAVARARRVRNNLDSLGDFREVYFTITTTAGNNVFLTGSVNAWLESVRDT